MVYEHIRANPGTTIHGICAVLPMAVSTARDWCNRLANDGFLEVVIAGRCFGRNQASRFFVVESKGAPTALVGSSRHQGLKRNQPDEEEVVSRRFVKDWTCDAKRDPLVAFLFGEARAAA